MLVKEGRGKDRGGVCLGKNLRTVPSKQKVECTEEGGRQAEKPHVNNLVAAEVPPRIFFYHFLPFCGRLQTLRPHKTTRGRF